MKKALLAIALGSLAGYAAAQSNVVMYGIVDAGVVVEDGGAVGRVTKLTGGVENGSRLGFRGTEDLGDGLKAVFVLEMGFNLDTGTSAQGGTLFGRQALVGLQGKAGAVTLGRQYTPMFLTLSSIDPFYASNLAGSAANLMSNAAIRMNNTVKYASPTVNGFSAELAYGFGETAGDSRHGRQIGASGAYVNGPFSVRAAYANINNIPVAPAPINRGKTSLLGATYDFGPAKVALAYAMNKGTVNINNTVNPDRNADNRDLMLGVSVPLGVHTLRASYIDKKDKAGTNRGASQWGVGYDYYLSKRTNLYLAYAHIGNDAPLGATGFYTVGNAAEVGSGNRGTNAGLRHTF